MSGITSVEKLEEAYGKIDLGALAGTGHRIPFWMDSLDHEDFAAQHGLLDFPIRG